jgi:3-methylcrotonyl-CoA carboxylase alpha subunit
VTEAVTGLDLVEWQLRVASGEKLPLRQEDIRLHGHAIEARICAEDPERDFLPSAGELRLLEWPSGEAIRVDAGFATGDEVPATYDSLLGKVIAWAPERQQAAIRLASALEQLYCAGVQTNERWLSRVLRAPDFLHVRHSIAFLQERGGDFAGPARIEATWLVLAALAAHAAQSGGGGLAASHSPWSVLDGFTPNLPARVDYSLTWHGHQHSVGLLFTRGRLASVTIDSATPVSIADLSLSDGVIAAGLGNTRAHARYRLDGTRLHLWASGGHYELTLEDPRLKEFSATAAKGGLTTPLPGVVATVVAKVGQAVRAGEVLMVIEAMKMEHSISAPYDGTVKVIHFARGDRVPEGSQLLELAPTAVA